MHVAAAQYSTEPEAYIACGMLRDEGVDAYVESNNMATLYGAGSTWAPIQVMVPHGQLDLALTLLRKHRDGLYQAD